MCTAIHDGALFGRTLDLELSYGESVVITPRNYRFDLLYAKREYQALAIIGMAHIYNGIPLYYDGMNESGLGAAALNFPSFAAYSEKKEGKINAASFELIPLILKSCKSLVEAKAMLGNINIVSDSISPSLPATPLHWIFADGKGSLVVESTADGIKLYDNAFGVLTNSPPFDFHIAHLSNFLHLSPAPPQNTLCPTAELMPYSRGLGTMGLAGDFSSASRFVRAVFCKSHTATNAAYPNAISRFFHIMDTVSQPLGCAVTDHGKPICTIYTSCADLSSGIYYFTTYSSRRICGIDMNSYDLECDAITRIDLPKSEDIAMLRI